MVQTPLKPITLEDFLQRPETKPASEFFDGQIIQKPMPKVAHSIIQGSLTTAINNELRKDQKACAFPELRCVFGGVFIVPDITVLPWPAIPRDEDGMVDGELSAAPPWMIEILSPGQNQSKVVKKILRAIRFGTQIGWLIDPAEKCVFVYQPELPIDFYEEADTKIPIPDFASEFSLTVKELFDWLYA